MEKIVSFSAEHDAFFDQGIPRIIPRNVQASCKNCNAVRIFDGIVSLRKILEEALNHTDDFGRDARSIMRTLENIKDPEQVEKTTKEDVDKIKTLNK